MKKKILLIFVLSVLLISIGAFYLNSVFLPVKIKSLIINYLQERTGRKASLESLQFSIFKGLVLKNLNLYEDKKIIISLKETRCGFFILPLLKKTLIIPSLEFRSPEVFLERQKDNTFNLAELFNKVSPPPEAKPGHPLPKKDGFNVLIYKISLLGGKIHFKDNAFISPFVKDIERLNLDLYLSLPASIKFNLGFQIPASPTMNLEAKGEFIIPSKQLTAKVSIRDLSPKEFSAYYQNLAVVISRGLIDVSLDIKLKDDILDANVTAEGRDLSIAKDAIFTSLASNVKADFKYGLKNRQVEFSGRAKIANSNVSGLELIGPINSINGEVIFNKSGISADTLSALIWDVPIQAKIKLDGFANPLLNIRLASDKLALDSLCAILKDKFKLVFPAQVKGEGNLSLNIETRIPQKEAFKMDGSLDILNAALKLDKVFNPIEDIKGRLEFSLDQLKWPDLNFSYLGTAYKTEGLLTDFKAPLVQFKVSSEELFLESSLLVSDKLIKLSRASGRYLNSDFSLAGNINIADQGRLETDINADLNIDLEDMKKPLKKFAIPLQQIQPKGIVKALVKLEGDINDLKFCLIQAELSSPSISAYGLKAEEFSLNYNQRNAVAEIPFMRLSLYGGIMELGASMNLNSDNLAYWLELGIKDLKIEKLKLDTPVKEKDIAGILQAQVKINGFSSDLAKLSGIGKISIKEGKLWELNLFKGLGSLLFAKDFAHIVFSEGSCAFSIQDKLIWTDNLRLKSDITDLTGSVKIGFDSALDASLNVQVLDEMVPLSGTFKDLTTAIIGQAGRFGVIKIGGTLKEPKYRFQPAVVDIIKGLKDVIFGR